MSIYTSVGLNRPEHVFGNHLIYIPVKLHYFLCNETISYQKICKTNLSLLIYTVPEKSRLLGMFFEASGTTV